jgi:hypothetical protein
MRKIYTFFLVVLLTASMLAQSPQKMSYQAVIRNSSDQLVTNHTVGMRISILQGSANGTAVYVETQTPTTNSNGLATIEIGSSTPVTGSFAGIDWSTGTYFIKTETDPTGGTAYTITGTSQLLSVPYALYAKTTAETDPVFGAWNKSSGINITASQVSDFQTNVTNNTSVLLNTAKVTNATHTGDATGSTALTVARINGTSLAGLTTGILKNTTGTGVPSIAIAGTDYLTPSGSAALLTNFPTLNQNTTGSAASFTGSLVGQVTGTQGATVVANSAVISKVLTGFTSGAGTITAADNILQAIQKLDGNNSSHYIGESYGGGIVFYVYDNGQHGLIAATSDQSTGVPWTNTAFQNTVSNVVRDGINGGLANTERIIIQAGAGNYAAQLCVNYNGGNYSDWYLPSKYELHLLYLQKAEVGGFVDDVYWSSTENNNNYAWYQVFDYDNQSYGNKSTVHYVRAIRAF